MKKRILIVDDSESVRALVVFILQKSGYEVLVGTNGQDALRHLNGQPIHAIITDYHMPQADGLSLVREIRGRSEYVYVPILFLTTETQSEKKQEARMQGATGWIVKPFTEEKLIAAIRKVLR